MTKDSKNTQNPQFLQTVVRRSLTHGSLFSGIGGFELASEWIGWENTFNCEKSEFCQKVLKYHFKNSIQYADIKQTNFSIHRGKIDVLSGGFPCQPYSVAGKRKGTDDDRHLWPEMLRAIREIQPRYIVGENVYGIINWNKGLVFDQIQTELEVEGYEVQAYVLPACGVNAPHKRNRVWFVAYRNDTSAKHTIPTGRDLLESIVNTDTKSKQSSHKTFGEFGQPEQRKFGGVHFKKVSADTNGVGQTQQGKSNKQLYKETKGNREKYRAFDGSGWESINPVCRGYDGFSKELYERSLESYGNAIVPQVAYQLFNAISLHDASLSVA